jgi:hypothetical protein
MTPTALPTTQFETTFSSWVTLAISDSGVSTLNPLPILATKATLGLANSGPRTGFTANAAYYDNAIWYFISNNTLTTNAPDSPPSPDQNKPERYAISSSSSDIPVVSASNQATLSSIPNLPSAIQTPLSPVGAALTPMANPSLQIFYDDGILDGQTHGADASGFSNGHVVDPGGWGTFNPLRDIAGASFRSNVVAPRPLTLLGAGAALGWSRRLRRRLRGLRPA